MRLLEMSDHNMARNEKILSNREPVLRCIAPASDGNNFLVARQGLQGKDVSPNTHGHP